MSSVKWVAHVQSLKNHLAQIKNSKVIGGAGPMSTSQREPAGQRSQEYDCRQKSPRMEEVTMKLQGGQLRTGLPHP